MDVNQLLNRFADAQKMMKQMGGMMGLPGMGRKATKSPKNKRKGGKGGNRQRTGGGRAGRAARAACRALPADLDAGPRPPGFKLPKLDFSKLLKRRSLHRRPVTRRRRRGRSLRAHGSGMCAGVVLPDDEVRDLWLVERPGDLRAGAGRDDLADRRLRPARPGRRALPHRHRARRRRRSSRSTRPGSWPLIDRDAGVLALRDAGSPYPYPELDDDPELPRLARAGRHVAPVKRYLRDIGVEVRGGRRGPRPWPSRPRAGNGWVKLVGDWIDRGRGDLAPAWDAGRAGRRGRGRARGRRPGGRAHVRRGGRGGAWCGPASTRSSTAPACASTTSTRWPGGAPRWCRR